MGRAEADYVRRLRTGEQDMLDVVSRVVERLADQRRRCQARLDELTQQRSSILQTSAQDAALDLYRDRRESLGRLAEILSSRPEDADGQREQVTALRHLTSSRATQLANEELRAQFDAFILDVIEEDGWHGVAVEPVPRVLTAPSAAMSEASDERRRSDTQARSPAATADTFPRFVLSPNTHW